MQCRVGFGFDVHPLISDRDFVLGGVLIPHPKGPAGHSDADVLIHAICDALLGAAGLRDIGFHFPDTEDQYKNIDSIALLKRVAILLYDNNYIIGNIDATVCLELPRLSTYIPQMKQVLAQALKISESAIGIKATTNERMGFVGREEGITAYAVALIELIAPFKK
jgi:2-C-methyl-D-erythritol 2,4-cyclodiphosphate synthase